VATQRKKHEALLERTLKAGYRLRQQTEPPEAPAGHPIIAAGDYTISIGGGEPDTGASGQAGHFHVDGRIALPE
jgi:hypothetical protein